jgi:putative oligomerization/nucleic acid binding protein
MRTILRVALGLGSTGALISCAVTSPIQPASASQSAFAGAVYKGETVTTGTAAPGNEAYRVFIQGATGFVGIQSVRDDAEQRAKEFCGRKDKVMESLSETTAKPPYILGNFPRVEIVFDCIAVAAAATTVTGDDPKYTKLMNLKKLLDGGAITQDEFDREKSKVLNEP